MSEESSVSIPKISKLQINIATTQQESARKDYATILM
jgi:hypothetical protein